MPIEEADASAPVVEAEKVDAKTADDDLVDNHLHDEKFVNFVTEAKVDMADTKRLAEYARVYDEIDDTTEQIVDVVDSKILDKLELSSVAGDAREAVKVYLLEKAKGDPRSVQKQYIDKVKEYVQNLALIQAKENELKALGPKEALEESRKELIAQRNEVRTQFNDAETHRQDLDTELTKTQKSKFNSVKRAVNFLRRRGPKSAQEKGLEAQLAEAKRAESAADASAVELAGRVREIDEKIAAIGDAQKEKASLQTSVTKFEKKLTQDAEMLKTVKELMVKAARERVGKVVSKLESQGAQNGGEASITLEEFAEAQQSYSMWEDSKDFAEFADYDRDATSKGEPTLRDELQHVLNVAIENELGKVDAGTLGGNIERFNGLLENSLPLDEAKNKRARQMIETTLKARLTSETDRVKQLYLNRVLKRFRLAKK